MSPDDQRSTTRLHVAVTDDRGRALRRPGLTRWLQRIAPARARGAVTVALVTDRVMRRMNLDYAGHDYATDVLSFAASEGECSPSAVRTLPLHLGDIVIATGVAARQAKDAGHSLETELRILALHGLLHLLGYDHTTDSGQMARQEARLRHKGGLGEGLIERSRRRPS